MKSIKDRKMKEQMKELDKKIEEKKIKEKIEEKKEIIKNNDLVNYIYDFVNENKNIIFDKNNKLTTIGVCFFIAISLQILNFYIEAKNGK